MSTRFDSVVRQLQGMKLATDLRPRQPRPPRPLHLDTSTKQWRRVRQPLGNVAPGSTQRFTGRLNVHRQSAGNVLQHLTAAARYNPQMAGRGGPA